MLPSGHGFAMNNRLLARILLTFVLAGPPVGALTFMVMATAYDAFVVGVHNVVGNLKLLPVALVLSYVPGCLPALISGLAMAELVRREWSFWPRLLAVLLVGALASLVILALFVLKAGGAQGLFTTANLAVSGATAACITTVLLERARGQRRGA